MKRNLGINKKSSLYALENLAVIVITIAWLLPVIWMLINSFRSENDPFYSGIFPSEYTLNHYYKILRDPTVRHAFRNSIIVSTGAAILDVILALLAGYGFSRYTFRGQRYLQILLLIIRLYPGMILAITLFQVAGFLKVYDTLIPLIFTNALINLPFGVWNLHSTFDALPIELEEASWLDGMSRLGGIVKILLPLMAPSVAATFAFIFLLSWNEYLFAVSFIRSPENHLITLKIAENIGQYHIDFIGLMASGMLATLPLLLIFLWIQRYIVKGLAAGAVRG
jgi:multiple sugar transport system permease protein